MILIHTIHTYPGGWHIKKVYLAKKIQILRLRVSNIGILVRCACLVTSSGFLFGPGRKRYFGKNCPDIDKQYYSSYYYYSSYLGCKVTKCTSNAMLHAD